ncbi:lysophosphatidic acid receptor 2-like [Physella acuta]|uniref:lysophosphatidic acid receptor 2-like n=1 Tax=Physella acuta TaxID=109671 RepID=UPI0027DE17DE|nr:lysophosphatidic acid receptor 2-like [Physella acuta]
MNVAPEADIQAHPAKLKKRKTRKVRFLKCQHLRDLRTIKTLMLMFVIYFICWSPIMACKFAFHLLMVDIDKKWFYTAWIVGASNSLWNFAVYPLRKAELRRAIRKIMCNVFAH